MTGEAFCPRVCGLEERALEEVCALLPRIREEDEDACEKLMAALLLSGLAMQMVGNSRPASGAEHHFSHLWEMEILNPHLDAYHGEKVSVGLITALEVYRRACGELAAGRYRIKKPYRGIETELLQKTVRSKRLLSALLRENEPDPLAGIGQDRLEGQVPDLVRILSGLPEKAKLDRMLSEAGCAASFADIGLDESVRSLSVRLSPYARNRLTLMRLFKLFEFEEPALNELLAGRG